MKDRVRVLVRQNFQSRERVSESQSDRPGVPWKVISRSIGRQQGSNYPPERADVVDIEAKKIDKSNGSCFWNVESLNFLLFCPAAYISNVGQDVGIRLSRSLKQVETDEEPSDEHP